MNRGGRRVVIVGGGTGEREAGDVRGMYRDGWEVWGLNAIRPKWTQSLRWSRWFNLHRYEHLKRDWPAGIRKEARFARSHKGVPFYVVDPWPEGMLPAQRIFPRERLRATQPRGDYHAGSFDWLVAYATYLRARAIAIVGINLNMESGEPISARACLEYWCGYAEGRGVAIVQSPECGFFYQYHLVRSSSVYGYDDVRLVEDAGPRSVRASIQKSLLREKDVVVVDIPDSTRREFEVDAGAPVRIKGDEVVIG